MIAFVSGIVRLIRTDSVVLDVHGVGYEVFISNALTQKIGDELFYIHINMFVKMPCSYMALSNKKIMKFLCA